MEWKKIDLSDSSTWPKLCEDVLFSDGQNVYAGWRTNDEDEDLEFVSATISDSWPKNITHWMPFPKLPNKDKENE